jgi:hypothetical protein
MKDKVKTPMPVKPQIVANLDPGLHKKLTAQAKADSRTIRQQVVYIIAKHFA